MILRKIQPVFWVTLFLMIVFNFFSSRFLSLHNIINLFQQGAVLLIVAAASTLVILSEGLDLSLGSVLTLAGITSVMSVNAGAPVSVAIGIGILTGAFCGAITGTLISVFNMQPFIATLGIQGVYYGISLVLTDSVAILTKNKTFIFFGSRIGYVPMAAIFGVGTFLIILYVFHNTPFGRYVVAIGGNEAGTRLSGVNTRFWKWFLYTFAGGVTGFAGVLLLPGWKRLTLLSEWDGSSMRLLPPFWEVPVFRKGRVGWQELLWGYC